MLYRWTCLGALGSIMRSAYPSKFPWEAPSSAIADPKNNPSMLNYALTKSNMQLQHSSNTVTASAHERTTSSCWAMLCWSTLGDQWIVALSHINRFLQKFCRRETPACFIMSKPITALKKISRSPVIIKGIKKKISGSWGWSAREKYPLDCLLPRCSSSFSPFCSML